MIKNVNVLFWVILFTTQNWEQWLGVQIQQRAGAKTQSLHLFKHNSFWRRLAIARGIHQLGGHQENIVEAYKAVTRAVARALNGGSVYSHIHVMTN